MSTINFRIFKVALWTGIAIAAILILYAWIVYERHFPSTDDAYVQANVINMAAQVTAPVVSVHVKNNSYVHRGDLLFALDPKPFQLAVDAAQAQLTATEQQIKAGQASVITAQAVVAQQQAQLIETQKSSARTLALVKKNLLAIAEGDKAVSALKVAENAYKAAVSELTEAQQKLGDPGKNNAQLRAAQARLDQAKLDLHNSRIYAPANGYIVNFSLRVGASVVAEQTLFELIDDSEWWVVANFKETDLDRIRPNQPAAIKIDMYPGHQFKGIVESLSAGSGESFSVITSGKCFRQLDKGHPAISSSSKDF